ncbi:MAG: hypothetical protein IKC00_05405, partial [Clostridia bacterium]|nr:hypothetical protein [Clostridia bacterium]
MDLMNIEKRKVMLTETILRDAHQSQAATRMRIDEMLPVLEQLDEIGYYSIEAWGGATFDSCLRFLNEDPWERLRTLKSHLKTPIQMLLRGQNLLGYRHYADDVVEKFVAKSIENGVGVVRVFDALNDPRNLEVSMKAIKKYGGVCEATICYTSAEVNGKEVFRLYKSFVGDYTVPEEFNASGRPITSAIQYKMNQTDGDQVLSFANLIDYENFVFEYKPGVEKNY